MMGEEPLHHEVPPSAASNTVVIAATASAHIVRSSNNSSSNSSSTPLVFDPPYNNHHNHHHHHHHHHIPQQQHNNHPFDSPSWDPHNNPIQQSTSSASSVSHSRSSNPYGTQSSSGTSSTIPNSSTPQPGGNNNKTITPPRRTRHRVDAGEPRGCFNSSGLSSAGLAAAAAASHFYHGNSSSNSNSRNNHLFGASRGGGQSNSAFSGGGYTNFIPGPHHQPQQQQHHHHPHFPQSPHHFGQFGQGPGGPLNTHPSQPQQPGSSPPSNEPGNYYFQPMKMLSEFISSASAVAAAQAAQQQSGNSRNSRTGGAAQPHHHSQQHHQNQLLLREMLCKSAAAVAASSQPTSQQSGGGGADGRGAQSQSGSSSRLNNNNIQKYGFEEELSPSGGHHQSNKASKLDGMIGMMMDKLNSAASSAISMDEDFNEDEESALLANNNGLMGEDEMEKPEVGTGKAKSISPSAGSNPEVSSELNIDEQEDDDQTSADAMDGVKSSSTVETDSVVYSGGASCTNNNNNNNSKDSQSELNNKSSAADLLNNNTTSSSQQSPSSAQQQQQTQTRNKRKKYQPQRSDLLLEQHRQIDGVVENGGGIIDEDEEEMLISGDVAERDEVDEEDPLIKRDLDDDDLNEEEEGENKEESNNRRITRSQRRRMGDSGEGENMEEETLENTEGTHPNDIDEEDISPEEYEARLLSSRRNNPNQAVLNATNSLRTITTTSTRVKRKLPEDFLSDDMDEDEAMLMRQVASGSRSSAATTTDDQESIKQEFENEEEEQEAMINDDLDHHGQGQGSRRTLPVVRNMMRVPISNHHRGVVGSNIKEAPLTRQLLTTERPTSNPSTNDQKPQISLLRQRNPAASPPSGDGPGNNFLQQWKENLKTTLMSHINELVEAQFNLLFSGGVLPAGMALPPQLQQQQARSLDQERRSLRESNNAGVPMSMRQNAQQDKGMDKRTPPPSHGILHQQQQQRENPHPPRSSTPRDQMKPSPLMHLNGGSVMNAEKLQMLSSPPMNEKKLPVGRAGGNAINEFAGLPPRFPFMQNLQNSHDQQRPGPPTGGQNGKPHFSHALVELTQQRLQQQALASAAAAAAAAAGAGIEFDSDGALSLVVNRQGGNGGGIVAEQLHGGNVTPRKKRHKVTDTRLTPRAVSRLLGQVDSVNSTSPLYDHHRLDRSASPAGSPSSHGTNGPIEPRSILQNGTPPPSQHHRSERDGSNPPRERTPSDRSASTGNQHPSDSTPRVFNPFQPPTGAAPFFHPAAALAAAAAAGHQLHPHHQLGRLDSPPMGNSLLHPALQNHSEFAERIREMEREREQQERHTRVGSDNVVVRDRGDHHHHPASLREFPTSVRGLRDRRTDGGGMMIANDLLELMSSRGGSAGNGSDSDRESNSAGGFDMGGGSGGMYCKWSHTTSTLTPMHLRKAKLMFFWTRYPSSAVIKMYFPDIKFNKNNTAQLVKWFSNFREFYYIQMEKYARQALSEGVKNAEDLVVTTDSELYRVLNLHYNRNNHIEVPSNFRFVVEQTLREFFKSVQAGKDSEQSWKKAIYKIIARLDDPVPEYFKSPNFLEQLE